MNDAMCYAISEMVLELSVAAEPKLRHVKVLAKIKDGGLER